MTFSLTYLKDFDLQLFAEGGAAAGAGAAGGDAGSDGATGVTATAAVSQTTKGRKANPYANVHFGIQEEADAPVAEEHDDPAPEVDRGAEFEKLIKGEYKDFYDAKVQETVQKRLKSSKETVERFEALAPVLELLGQKYGVDATDIEALSAAIEEDDSFYEEEALATGSSVEEIKRVRKIERENETLKQQMRERNTQEEAAKIYTGWMKQAEEMKPLYPTFNLDAELQNQQFVSLLRSGIDVKTAFEVIHKDEIIPAAMQYTAKTVEKQVVNRIKANGMRPIENGSRSQGASIVKSDPSQLSKAERAEANRRVMQGQRLSFGNTRQ